MSLPEATQAVYVEMLTELSPEQFVIAVKRTLVEWDRPNMMPPIAFILARSGQSRELRAEQAWNQLRDFVYKNWHPDIGYTSALRLDPASEYAVKQVGGLRRIHNMQDEHIQFVQRDFLENFRRFEEEGGAQTLLSDKLAKDTLKELEELGRKQLPGKTGD